MLAASAFPNMRAMNASSVAGEDKIPFVTAVNLLMSADVSATSAFVASVAVAVASSAMCCLSSSAVSSARALSLFEAWLLEVG